MPRGARRVLLIALLALAGLAVWLRVGSRKETSPSRHAAQPAPAPANPVAAARSAPTPVNSSAGPAHEPAVVAFHELLVDTPLIALARQSGDPAALRRFTVRLGPDRFAEVDVGRFDAIDENEGVYSGVVRGQRDSQAIFSYVGLAYAGTVVLPAEERAFCITATEDGRMRITELDLTRAPLCGQPLLAHTVTAPSAVLLPEPQ